MTAVAGRRVVTACGETVTDVLLRADAVLRDGSSFAPAVHRTGFCPLDDYLGGGLRAGELTLLGGPQGLGKTVFALQAARHVAASGGRATYVSYEHDVEQVLERLLALEAGLTGGQDAVTLDEVRLALAGGGRHRSLADLLGPAGAAALETVRGYGDRLRLVRASGAHTGVEQLRDVVGSRPPDVLVVDYLQKIAAQGVAGGEDERVTHVVSSLKDLALDRRTAVLAVVAADKVGLSTARVRLHHLRGSTALAYEADVVLMLNDKYEIVARHHLMYGTTDADRYREWVVCSVEKNRSGVAGVDLEFRKHFAHGHVDPHGRVVAEVLADPRLGHD